MLISYQWLKKYVSIREPVEAVIDKLIHAGVAVENVRHVGNDITRVAVAELLSVEKHPQADRLSLTKVSDGKETFQVVCGAKNIAPGQKVPLARVGAHLPGNFEIKAAKIRGVESFGMLCSAKELALSEDAEGILILPAEAPVGTDFLEYMGLPDTLFELEITPNRADLLSHLGVAREVAALFHKPFHPPEIKKLKEVLPPISKRVQVTIEAKDLCHLYTCRVLEGVQIGPSPLWLTQALAKMGQRSINNIVDITNYVLLETGQPLHAFDLGHIHGSKVLVRRAMAGERIPLLDGIERELGPEMLVIADADRPVALAGIMGGSNSQVTGLTNSILLESALFLPGSIRKTARQLAISTDSSYRFERGVDPEGVEKALERAASLILELAGGSLAKGTLSPSSRVPRSPMIPFRPSRANALLGIELTAPKQVKILKDLGCRVTGGAAKTLSVVPPSRRLDLTREIDLIEEIARITGYDHIPVIQPRVPSALLPITSTIPFEKEVHFTLQQAGFYEVLNSTFLPPDFGEKLRLEPDSPFRPFQELANPIAEDQRALRPTLLPSLLTNVQLNQAHQQGTIALYEVNKVFTSGGRGPEGERLHLACVYAGTAFVSGWYNPERKSDFFDIKGLAENLLERCRLTGLEWVYGKVPAPYLANQSIEVRSQKGERLLWGGSLHPKVLKAYDIVAPCFALETDLGTLDLMPQSPLSFRPLPKFPAAWRDIALVVPDGVTSRQVAEAIEEHGKPDLKSTALFDLYRGPHLPPGVRSLAFRLHFQNEERTLTDQEVTDKVTRIVDHLKMRYAIALR
jgi:phenylalanyl-tRNA synthetase beta chain